MAKTWQETLLTWKDLKDKGIGYIEGDITKLLEAQAEITWEARDPEIVEAKLLGIKEVVEWIEDEDAIDRMMRERWQAFLKEKGIAQPSP